MTRFSHLAGRCLVVTAAIALAIGCGDPDETENDDNQTNQTNQPNAENDDTDTLAGLQCDADSWECSEFVAGADLSINRLRHHSAVINEDEVVLLGGSERLDGGGATTTETFEIFDTTDDRVSMDAEELHEPKRNFSVVQLENRSVLLVGGESGGDRVRTVEHLHPDSLEWTSLAEMNASYRDAVRLDDGRILVMGVTHSPDPPQLIGQTFDTESLSWSLTESAEFDQQRIYEVTLAELSAGRIAVAYAYLAPEDEQPDMEELDTFHGAVMGVDLDDGSSEVLYEFDETTFGYQFDFVELRDSDDVMLNVYTSDFDEEEVQLVEGDTLAYRIGADDEQFDQLFVRDPSPGEVLEVLPGDELIYSSEREVQLYDVDGDAWRTFAQLPDGIRFSTMDLLSDCRLFMAGERTLVGGERQGIHTGYCEPAN